MNDTNRTTKRGEGPEGLVSIGMPVFNGERFIAESLESLLAQSFGNIEIIISDNASNDGTEEICRAYAKIDSRVHFYKNSENLGAAENYNRVFALSKGLYFKWQAVDDKCHPDFISQCLEVLKERRQFVLAYSKTFIIDIDGNFIEMEDIPLRFDACDPVERFSFALDPIPYTDMSIFGLARRDVLAKTHLIGRYLASDRCLISELALHGPFFRIDEPLFYRRKHVGNISTSPEYLDFYDPKLKGRIVFPELRVVREQLNITVRSPVKLLTKLKLITLVLQRGFEKRRTILWEIKGGLLRLLGISRHE